MHISIIVNLLNITTHFDNVGNKWDFEGPIQFEFFISKNILSKQHEIKQKWTERWLNNMDMVQRINGACRWFEMLKYNESSQSVCSDEQLSQTNVT